MSLFKKLLTSAIVLFLLGLANSLVEKHFPNSELIKIAIQNSNNTF